MTEHFVVGLIESGQQRFFCGKECSVHNHRQAAMHSFLWRYGFWAISFWLVPGAVSIAAEASTEQAKHVLLLNSYHKGYLWTDEITRGVEETLKNSNCKLYVEYMDTKRFFEPAYLQELGKLLRIKYSKVSYDVVISADNDAYEYLLQVRKDVLGNPPIVCCGINYLRPGEFERIDNATAIDERADLLRNVQLIQKLHPLCRKILVIADDTSTGLRVQEEFSRVKSSWSSPVKLELVHNISSDALMNRLQGLPADTVVLLTVFFRDNQGVFFEYDKSTQMVSANSPVPVYGCWDFQINHGIVGGYLVSGFEQGAAAAQRALQILAGTRPDDIPVCHETPTTVMFDDRQLQKYKIPLRLLPDDSVILNQPVSFYYKHKTLIWIVAFAFALQMLAIVALLFFAAARKRAELAMRDSQRQLQNVLDAASFVSIIATDSTGTITVFNTGAEHMLGYAAEEMIGLHTPMIFHRPAEIDAYAAELSRKYGRRVCGFEAFTLEPQGGGYTEREWTYVAKGGECIRVVLGITPIRNEAGLACGFLGIAMNITARKQAEEQLCASRQMLNDVIGTIPVRVFWKDLNGVFLGCNRIFAEDAGKQSEAEVIGFTDYDMNWVEHADQYRSDDREIIESGKPRLNYDKILELPGGVKLQMNASKVPLRNSEGVIYGLLGVYEDVTERRRVEEQLLHSQKMDAIGQLAGGVAHDFNNMLGGILASAEPLNDYVQENPKARKFQKMIVDSAERAAGLTQKLLTFARKQQIASTAIDVHEVIRDTVALLKSTIDRRIEVVVELEAESSRVVGDPSLLQSAFLNLGINASHALQEGGFIYVVSRTQTLDAAYCQTSSFKLKPGRYLDVEMRDTGCGIPPENLAKIFDPFFTTKEQGKGTGLGLAAVYGTVQQHGGAISVASQPNRGTCFHILLPLADEHAKIQNPQIAAPVRGTGKILVIDDEDVMRVSAKAILENLGYEVVLAENGREGLEVYRADNKRADLVVLDMVMPKMNGRDCFFALKKINPSVRVVLSSGFTREEDLSELKRNGLCGFVRKPFRSAELSAIIHRILIAGQPRGDKPD